MRARWVEKEPLALDPIIREGRGRTATLVIAYRPWADMIE